MDGAAEPRLPAGAQRAWFPRLALVTTTRGFNNDGRAALPARLTNSRHRQPFRGCGWIGPRKGVAHVANIARPSV
jgi:hypothetical protein